MIYFKYILVYFYDNEKYIQVMLFSMRDSLFV